VPCLLVLGLGAIWEISRSAGPEWFGRTNAFAPAADSFIMEIGP
jgi:hypothetical protein